MFYLPEAKVYVKQEVVYAEDVSVRNYFSLQLLPFLFDRLEHLDYIEMCSPPLDFSQEIILQSDSLCLFFMDNRPSRFLDYQERCFHIERYENLVPITTLSIMENGEEDNKVHYGWPVCPERFYSNRQLRPGYVKLYNSLDVLAGYSFSASSIVKKTHLWFLLLPPRKI